MKEFTEGQMEVAEKECGEIQMLCGENVPLNNVEEEERKAVQIAVGSLLCVISIFILTSRFSKRSFCRKIYMCFSFLCRFPLTVLNNLYINHHILKRKYLQKESSHGIEVLTIKALE